MKIIIKLILVLLPFCIKGQSFNTSKPCNVNVNESQNFRDIVKKATFKIRFVGPNPGTCTGTLINRDIEQNQLGFFFVIARHCLIAPFANSGIDPTREHEFSFNYQAPDPNNNFSTPVSNRGRVSSGLGVQSRSTSDDGYQYLHRSPIRIISWYFWGDFALCEILNPIPPHFNVTFAGWNPGLATFVPVPFSPEQYFNPHHPAGDIKKMSSTFAALSAPSDVGCRVVTKVVDFLFGWIWGRRWSTEVICTYSEIPWAYVPLWDIGTIQGGSSGSGLFNGNNRLLAVLSGGPEGCLFNGSTAFGKLRSSYYNQSVKNTLNPENKYWTDQFGIEGRNINCYQSLNNLNGEYFAANAYQSNNKITLQSSTTITTNGTLRIHPGADFDFISETGTTLNSGFEIVSPATGETRGVFQIKTGSCVVPRNDENSDNIPYSILERAKNLQLPEYKPFNLSLDNKSLTDINSIQVFPNPNDGDFTIRFETEAKSKVQLNFTDMLGRSIFSTTLNTIQGDNYYPLNLNEKKLQAGVYFIILTEGENKKVQKVMIQ